MSARAFWRRRWAGWLGGGLAALALLALAVRLMALAPVTHRLVERQVGALDAAGQTITLEGLRGDLLGEMAFDTLAVSDGSGEWLEAQGGEVSWSPLALLGRHLDVAQVRLKQLDVQRRPQLERAPSQAGTGPSPLRRYSLDTLEIAALSIDDERLDGPVAAKLSGAFQLAETGGQAQLRLVPETPSGDDVAAQFRWGGEDGFSGALSASGPGDGLLAAALSPTRPGPISAELNAGRTEEGWRVSLETAIAGEVALRLLGTDAGGMIDAAGEMDLLAFEATQAAAPWLGPRAVLNVSGGERVTAVLTAQKAEITAATLRPAAGQTDGLAPIDLNARLKAPLTLAGRSLALTAAQSAGTLSFSGADVTYSGVVGLSGLESDQGSAEQVDISGDLARRGETGNLSFVGRIQSEGAALRAPDTLGILGTGQTLDLDIAFDPGSGVARVNAAELQAGLGTLNAAGEIGLADMTVTVAGGLSLASAMLERLGLAEAQADFEIDTPRPGEYAVEVAAPFALDAPPHPLLAGALQAGVTGTLTPGATFDLERASLTGQQVSATMAGQVSPERVDVSLEAEAAPLSEGPVSTGAVTLIAAAKGPWQALSVSAAAGTSSLVAGDVVSQDVGAQLSGRYGEGGFSGEVSASATTQGRAATLFGNLELSGPSWAVAGLQVAWDGIDLTADLTGEGAALNLAAISLTAPGDALGRLGAEGLGSVAADVSFDGATFAGEARMERFSRGGVRVEDAELAFGGPLDQVSGMVSLSGELPVLDAVRTFEISAPFDLDTAGQSLRVTPSGAIGGEAFQSPGGIAVSRPPEGIAAEGALEMFGGEAAFLARQGPDALGVSLTLTPLDAARLARFLGRPALTGAIGGGLELSGAAGPVTGTGFIDVVGLGLADPSAPRVSGRLDAALSPSALSGEIAFGDGEGLTVSGSAQVPMAVRSAPLAIDLTSEAPLNAVLTGRGPIEPIWSFVGPIDTALTGDFDISATVDGTLAAPGATGRLELFGAGIEDAVTGLHLVDLALLADLDRDTVTVRRLSAKGARGGEVTGAGRYSIGGSTVVDLSLRRLDALQRSDITAVVSGDLALSDTAAGAQLVGSLDFDAARIDVDRLPEGGYVTLDVTFPDAADQDAPGEEAAPALPLALDIGLKADRRIRVVGGGIETEWSLDAQILGSAREPRLVGGAELVRGDVDLLGRTFGLAGSRIAFNGAPSDSELALQASRTDGGFTAQFLVSGTPSDPAITLTSSPQVPESEILSRALFGASPSQLSPTQAAQLAAGLAQLSGGGGLDLLGGLEDALDVDRIDLGVDDAGDAFIGAGKYIADDVYLELKTTTRGAPGLGLEWTPRENLELGAEFGTEVTPRFTLNWTRDYGAPEAAEAQDDNPAEGGEAAPSTGE